MTTIESIAVSANHLTKDFARFVAGTCDERSFEDRIDQLAADIDKHRGTFHGEALHLLARIVAAYDAGWEDDPTAPDITDALMNRAREIVCKG